MIAPEELKAMLARMIVASPTSDGVRVSTHVLYPSNGSVSVVVRGGTTEFFVSDEGGAISEILSAGIVTAASDRMVRARVKRLGLHVQDGTILSPAVSLDAVPATVMLVANASRSIADWGMQHLHYHKPRNFREDLEVLLQRHFHDKLTHDTPIVGSSNKPHRFGYVVYLGDEKKLLIDPVVNDSSSINARVVANLDVKMAHDPLIRQIIVYDDELKWKASDLTLLQIGAPTVAFSKAELEIERLVA